MKSNSFFIFAYLFSLPGLAQTLPDEINYVPYENRYRLLENDAQAVAAQLNQSRTDLAQAQRFIREMTAHISSLESENDENESEIGRLTRQIPILERQMSDFRNEDSRLMSDLRVRQNEEIRLLSANQQAQRDLRPLEMQFARKEQRLRELELELNQQIQIERQAEARLGRALNEAQEIDRRFEQERNQMRQMETELRNTDSRISSVQAEISRFETSSNNYKNNLNTEKAKLTALNTRVSDYESDLARLRSSGASAEDIVQAERKLNAAKSARITTSNEIKNIENQLSRNEVQIRIFNGQIDELRRNQKTLPGRIAQSEAQQRQLTIKRGQTQNEINRFQVELQQVRRSVSIRISTVESFKQDMRNDELSLNRQRQLLENINRQLQATQEEITTLTERSRSLNAEISRALETTRSHQATIPKLEKSIRENQTKISEGQRDVVVARNDEIKLTTAIERYEVKLAEVTRLRDNAQNEISTRINLYNQYMDEAEKLGSNQSNTGTSLGSKEGLRLSSFLSKQNGVSAGRELGIAEAKNWGNVRGEIQGHELGYSEGLASVEDRTRAQVEAIAKAASDAELFAQTKLRPVFFEEFIQEEFKKPLVNMAINKSSQMMKVNFLMEERMETISPLLPSEIERSSQIVTALDEVIVLTSKDVKAIEAKARRLSDPEVTFEAPKKIPYATVNCAQVYKAVAVFKAACEKSYKTSFADNYVNAAHDSFATHYQAQFTSEFNLANITQREVSYPAELAVASKVGRAEGLRVGKIEIYRSSFESSYNSSYVSELEKARMKAKMEAAVELGQFLKVKPLLTVTSTQLLANNFRGDEEVSIIGKIKNVSFVPLNGPVLVRLTEVVNAEKLTGQAVLNSLGALSETDLPELKVRVSSSAKAGDKMILRGVVDLPGDLYRPARQEKFEFIQALSENPSHFLGLNFNKTPDIKGVFRRNVHVLTMTITPKVDNIISGYKLSLAPVGDAASLVEIKETQLETGSMSVGNQKQFEFSYLFKDAAKGKTISLELSVTYAGKVIKKEIVTVVPK
jgi:predicted  nucleic acid-binding Zn-ribbon protein